MGIKKSFLKTKPLCNIEFSVPDNGCSKVEIVGDFNDWNASDEFTFKKNKKRKEHVLKLKLPQNATYQYRYLIDGDFVNEPEADSLISNSFGTQNCVLDLNNN